MPRCGRVLPVLAAVAMVASGCEFLERVSVPSAGGTGGGGSYEYSTPAISGDGRFVAFGSDAADLVPGDTNGKIDVFVRDILSNTTVRVSVSTSGVQANGHSVAELGDVVAISGSGRHVAFASDATNLVSGDTNGFSDIFVRDRDVDEDGVFDEPGAVATRRVSRGAFPASQANGPSYSPALSQSGRSVAFWSAATTLVPGDTNGFPDTFLAETEPFGTNPTRMAGKCGDQLPNGPSHSSLGWGVPMISIADLGSFVSSVTAFVTSSSVVDSRSISDTNGVADVVVTVPQGGATCGVMMNGHPSNSTTQPFPSGFGGIDLALRPGDSDDFDAVVAFVADPGVSTPVLVTSLWDFGVSSRPIVQQEALHGYHPSLAADGFVLSYATERAQVGVPDTNNKSDVYLKTVGSATARRVSVGGNGEQGDDDSYGAVLSEDGAYVAFVSEATNFGDTNGVTDVYVHSTRPPITVSSAVPQSPLHPGASNVLVGLSGSGFGNPGAHLGALALRGSTPLPVRSVDDQPGLASVSGDSAAFLELTVPPGTPPGPVTVILFQDGPLGGATGVAGACAGCLSVETAIFQLSGNSPIWPPGDLQGRGDYTLFATAAGRGLVVDASLPATLGDFECVVLPANQTTFGPSQLSALASYLAGGGTVIAAGEQVAFNGANQVMRDLATALGAELGLTDGAFDGPGFATTTDIGTASPFTDGVADLRFGNVSRVEVSGDARVIARTPGAVPFIGVDQIGAGHLVLTGDINWISDASDDGYTNNDNGILAENLCG